MEPDISKLVDKYQLSKTEENILIFIIKNIKNVKKIGVRGIAKENYTSTTTVVNLAKKLGYSGFLDMYYNLNFMMNDKKSYFLKEKNKKYYGVDIDELLKLVDYESVNEFINLLIENKSRVIYTLGQGFSNSIAEYITRKLIVLGFNCIFSDSYESYDVNPVNAKLLITVSKSGETDYLIKLSELAKKNGIQIVSFTGETENRLARMSDINFKIYDMYAMDDRNKMSNSFYPNVLMLFEFIIGEYLSRCN